MTGRSLPTGTVTFLFTDIEGSTRLVQALGESWVETLEAHDRVLANAIETRDGIVVKTEGDSFFAVFPSAIDALLAAVAAQHGLASRQWSADGAVRSRMGLHTGLGQMGGADYVGLDVHRAARIADAAHGGQVVLSESTAVLVERDLPSSIRLRDLGKHHLKDLLEPETIFQVVIDDLANDFPQLRTLDAIPNNLPKQLTSFVGRERELAEAVRLLVGSRILTMTGPGGTGKTRLALQAAAEVSADFADGVFFVDLAPVTDPDIVPTRILDAIGVQASTMDHDPPNHLMNLLAAKESLLILDNFEQLPGAAPLIADLVRSAPRCKMLVTSRAPLHISGEQEMPVPPLGIGPPQSSADGVTIESDAVRLFVDRAMAVRPDFVLSPEDVGSIVELVKKLDGLPLAIELVAARLRLLTVEQILSRLNTRLLASGSIDLPERQRTIEGAIAWSHDLLGEPARRLFGRFGVFAGGARLEELEEVCGPSEELGEDLLDCIAVLVDHSLVRRVDNEGNVRFRMLNVIQEYARERLADSGEAEEMARRHATAYLRLVESAEPELLRKNRKTWLDILEHDHDNVRAALDWSVANDADLSLRLAAAAWRFWQARGHLHEAGRRLKGVLALEGGELRSRAKATEALGGILWWQGQLDACFEVYAQALDLARELGDKREIANALYNYSLAIAFAGANGVPTTQSYEEAERALDEAEGLYREIGSPGGLGDVEWGRGNAIAYVKSDFAAAATHMKKSIDYYREAGNEFGMGWGLFEVGEMARRSGDSIGAWPYVEEGLALFADHKDVSGVVLFLAAAAGIALEMGDIDRAHRLAGAYNALRAKTGTDIVRTDVNRIDALDLEVLEALSGDDARPYLEGGELDLERAVAYGLAGPTDV
jgi:predicted ATPase/class 3 adenylate cyclase